MGLEENVQNKNEAFLWFREREGTDGIGQLNFIERIFGAALTSPKKLVNSYKLAKRKERLHFHNPIGAKKAFNLLNLLAALRDSVDRRYF